MKGGSAWPTRSRPRDARRTRSRAGAGAGRVHLSAAGANRHAWLAAARLPGTRLVGARPAAAQRELSGRWRARPAAGAVGRVAEHVRPRRALGGGARLGTAMGRRAPV